MVTCACPRATRRPRSGRSSSSIRTALVDGVRPGRRGPRRWTTTPPTPPPRIAADAGARVVARRRRAAELGPGEGKGEALWKSVAAARGDLIVWCDADIRDFAPHFVIGLLGPLLTRSDIAFVKGFYDRPVDGSPRRRARHRADGPAGDRGAVPPPGLDRAAAVGRVRRPSVAARAPAVRAGYGVDLGLLIDIAEVEGTEAIAQVDLGLRRHRNRPLEELGPQALAVLQTALARASDARAGRPPWSGPTSSPSRSAPTSGRRSPTCPATAAARLA